MIRRNRRLAAMAALILGTTGAAHARVEVLVSHVGFPSVAQGDIVRAGSWAPIYVDVSLVDQPTFDGSLRASQLDTDGDEIYDSVEVHLRAETGGHSRIILYVPVNPIDSLRYAVELRDTEGSVVQVISDGVPTVLARPAEAPHDVGSDDIVVLSVADGAIGRVKDLAGVQQGRSLRQTVHVAHISPVDLPEHWIGLEAVDFIVWEDARPERLTPRQLEALIAWVQHGGTLLIAASESAVGFQLIKPLSAIMPADVTQLVSMTDLPRTRSGLLAAPTADEETPVDWKKIPFPNAVAVGVARVRPAASIMVREPVTLPGGEAITSDIVTRMAVGSGHVILCAVRMHDLFSAPGTANSLFEKLFHFIPSAANTTVTPVSLFGNVASSVGFVRSRSAYLVITFLFALAYVLVATWGSWAFLSRRGWRQHSWTAFAGIAILAGIGAGVAVGAARGITDRLQQVAVIDTAAGETFGRGTAFFGLKTGIDKTLDLWLPPDWLMAKEPEASSCFLRPLPAGSDWRQLEKFADPIEYILRPASGEVDGARFRATLKRFEGRWDGPLGGQLQAQIAVQGKDRVLTEDSFVINNLGVELTNCRLIHTLLDPETPSERSRATYVYTVDGTIPSDGSKVRLHERCFRLSGAEKITDVLRRSQLGDHHKDWSSKFAGLLAGLSGRASDEARAALGKEREALMLLSTVGDFDPGTIPSQLAGSYIISRDRLRHLDLRSHLTAGHNANKERAIPADNRGTMILIGFAKGGGPLRLMGRSSDEDAYAAIQPEEDSSWCMYRIRLPFVDLQRSIDESSTESTE